MKRRRNAVAEIYDRIDRNDIAGANRLFAQAVKDAGDGKLQSARSFPCVVLVVAGLFAAGLFFAGACGLLGAIPLIL